METTIDRKRMLQGTEINRLGSKNSSESYQEVDTNTD